MFKISICRWILEDTEKWALRIFFLPTLTRLAYNMADFVRSFESGYSRVPNRREVQIKTCRCELIWNLLGEKKGNVGLFFVY